MTLIRYNARRAWRRSSRRAQPASSDGLTVTGLSFRAAPGPMLAVVGLSGGAGASVLAYLIAATAAAQSRAPVLLADTGGPTAGVATYTATTAPLTLTDISARVAAAERVPPRFWADGTDGLRVLAGDPQFTVQGDDDAVRRVLDDAHEAHGLTVVDCGTLGRPAEQAALSIATHIAWILPASTGGLERGRRVLECITRLSRPEILIARAQPPSGKLPVGAIADVADTRRAPLVLMPCLGEVTERPLRDLTADCAVTLQAIGGLLQR
jgi:Flp pilus assembly CpaE family ATPase